MERIELGTLAFDSAARGLKNKTLFMYDKASLNGLKLNRLNEVNSCLTVLYYVAGLHIPYDMCQRGCIILNPLTVKGFKEHYPVNLYG